MAYISLKRRNIEINLVIKGANDGIERIDE